MLREAIAGSISIYHNHKHCLGVMLTLDLSQVDRLGLETFALRARMLHKELRPLYGLIQACPDAVPTVLLPQH